MPDTIVISDTSCLIVLAKLEMLSLLKSLYQRIIVTDEIVHEFGETLPNWIEIHEVKNKEYQKVLEQYLDRGEASAIALASQFDNILLILDDLKGRKEAFRLGYKITGTLGILVRAKNESKIELVKPYLIKLQEVGFRISEKMIQEILKKVGEQ